MAIFGQFCGLGCILSSGDALASAQMHAFAALRRILAISLLQSMQLCHWRRVLALTREREAVASNSVRVCRGCSDERLSA